MSFGQECLYLVQGAKKLDARAKEGIFVGYDKYSPAYLVFDPVIQVVRKFRCVKFLARSSQETPVNEVPTDVTNPEVVEPDDPKGGNVEENVQVRIEKYSVPMAEPVQTLLENRRYPI